MMDLIWVGFLIGMVVASLVWLCVEVCGSDDE